MQKSIGIMFTVMLFFSCGKNAIDSANESIIPKEKFIPLLVDLQVLESYFQFVYKSSNEYRNSLDSSSVLVFNKYGTTKSNFDKSFSFYAGDLDEIFSIYESALDSLNFRINTTVAN